MNDVKPAFRRRARRMLVQALYQWQLSGESVHEIELQFCTFNNMSKVDAAYFHDLLHDITRDVTPIDAYYAEYLERPLEDLDIVEKQILRLGSYELAKRPEIPYKIILDEAIGLAKRYANEDSFKFVNAVLDKTAQQLRAIEIKSSSNG